MLQLLDRTLKTNHSNQASPVYIDSDLRVTTQNGSTYAMNLAAIFDRDVFYKHYQITLPDGVEYAMVIKTTLSEDTQEFCIRETEYWLNERYEEFLAFWELFSHEYDEVNQRVYVPEKHLAQEAIDEAMKLNQELDLCLSSEYGVSEFCRLSIKITDETISYIKETYGELISTSSMDDYVERLAAILQFRLYNATCDRYLRWWWYAPNTGDGMELDPS